MAPLGKAWSLNLAILAKACFSSGLPGAALAQLAAIVNPANKLTQIEMHLQAQIERWAKTWLSYSVFEKKNASQQVQFFFQKKGSPNFVLPQKRTLQTIHEFQNNLDKIATIATLATNQELTLNKALVDPPKNSKMELPTCFPKLRFFGYGHHMGLKMSWKFETAFGVMVPYPNVPSGYLT